MYTIIKFNIEINLNCQYKSILFRLNYFISILDLSFYDNSRRETFYADV